MSSSYIFVCSIIKSNLDYRKFVSFNFISLSTAFLKTVYVRRRGRGGTEVRGRENRLNNNFQSHLDGNDEESAMQ